MTIKQETLRNIHSDSDPAGKALGFMMTKAILLEELYLAFRRLRNQQGLLFFNEPFVDIQITKRPESFIKINFGKDIDLECQANAFPFPAYEYFKDDIKICDGPVFSKKSVMYFEFCSS